MHKIARFSYVALGTLAILSLIAAAASAHSTVYSPDNKIKFVYGNLNEPAFTFVKTGIDLTISDNVTGTPIAGLDNAESHGQPAGTPKIFVNIRYGEEGGQTLNISNSFGAQFGQPGKYTHPIVYTKPGLYYLVITGTINGTKFQNFAIKPAHPIESQGDIMWPNTFQDPDEHEARIAALESKMDSMGSGSKGNAPGLDVVAILAAIALCVAILRRK